MSTHLDTIKVGKFKHFEHITNDFYKSKNRDSTINSNSNFLVRNTFILLYLEKINRVFIKNKNFLLFRSEKL